MYDKLVDFINANDNNIFITGGINPQKINEIEEVLGIEICDEYKRFLNQFGMIMGFGITILGCGKSGNPSVITQTLRFRDFGLEKKYIVVCSADEWIYCLNSETNEISSWDAVDQRHKIESSGFSEFVLRELLDAKADW